MDFLLLKGGNMFCGRTIKFQMCKHMYLLEGVNYPEHFMNIFWKA